MVEGKLSNKFPCAHNLDHTEPSQKEILKFNKKSLGNLATITPLSYTTIGMGMNRLDIGQDTLY